MSPKRSEGFCLPKELFPQQCEDTTLSPNATTPESEAFLPSPPMLRPPLSVVVVRDPSSSGSLQPGSSTPNMLRRTLNVSSPPKTKTAFRLQPRRNSVKCTPSFDSSRGSPGTRGRKRRAHSISSAMSPRKLNEAEGISSIRKDSLAATEDETLSTQQTTAKKEFGYLPFRLRESDVPVESAVLNFQGMSLQSPQDGEGRAAERLSPLSFSGSQHSMFRSSFTRYSASPASTVNRTNSSGSPDSPPRFAASRANRSMASSGSPEAPKLEVPRASPPRSITSSSPKLAPLKILSHNDSKTPTSTERPPLHGGVASLLHALNEGESGDDEPVQVLPPSTVHCQASPSSDSSISTTFDVHYTPTKQARTEHFQSPGRKMSVDSPSRKMSPHHTPLPKVGLTPRSTSSRGSTLPRFPSPSELEDEMLSPSTFTYERYSIAATVDTSFDSSRDRHVFRRGQADRKHPPMPLELHVSSADQDDPLSPPIRQKESFIPLADWEEGLPQTTMSRSATREDHQTTQGKPTIQSVLFPPSRSTDDLNGILDRSERGLGDAETGSLSDSDDDEPFLLAPPSAIEEEKRMQQDHVKQRKPFQGRRSSSQGRLSITSSAHPSDASLLGVGLVNSNASLFAMDKNSSSCSKFPRPSSNDAGNLNREESLASIGLALEGTTDGRDLITPPVMKQARSPPPLSPRGRCCSSEDSRRHQLSNSPSHAAAGGQACVEMFVPDQQKSPLIS